MKCAFCKSKMSRNNYNSIHDVGANVWFCSMYCNNAWGKEQQKLRAKRLKEAKRAREQTEIYHWMN